MLVPNIWEKMFQTTNQQFNVNTILVCKSLYSHWEGFTSLVYHIIIAVVSNMQIQCAFFQYLMEQARSTATTKVIDRE